MPIKRRPGVAAMGTQKERHEKLMAARAAVNELRKELKLAEAEARFLALHLELFPEGEEES